MGFTGKCYVFGILFIVTAFFIAIGVLSIPNSNLMLVGDIIAGIMGFIGILLVLIGFLAPVWKT